MVSVVTLHAALAYTTLPMPDLLWLVHDGSRNAACDWIAWALQGFSMPVFFAIAGYAAAARIDAAGADEYLADRWRRLLVPSLGGMILLLPVTFYVWSLGWISSGRCVLRDVLRVDFPDDIQRNLWGPAHLWFLEYLILHSLCFWTIERLRAHGRGVLPFAVPVVFSLAVLAADPQASITLRNSFLPAPGRFAFYAAFFAAGVCFRRSPLVAEGAARWKAISGSVAALSLIAMGALLRRHLQEPLAGAALVALALSIAAYAWSSCFAAFGAALSAPRRHSELVQRLGRASFCIYLVHLPAVGLAAVALSRVSAPASVEVPLVVLAGIAVGIAAHERVVERTFLGRWIGRGPKEVRQRDGERDRNRGEDQRRERLPMRFRTGW
jgi:glucan biosynthesis protein C